jgi:hypothetical protein
LHAADTAGNGELEERRSHRPDSDARNYLQPFCRMERQANSLPQIIERISEQA